MYIMIYFKILNFYEILLLTKYIKMPIKYNVTDLCKNF